MDLASSTKSLELISEDLAKVAIYVLRYKLYYQYWPVNSISIKDFKVELKHGCNLTILIDEGTFKPLPDISGNFDIYLGPSSGTMMTWSVTMIQETS